MKFLQIEDKLVNRFLIALAAFDGETLTLHIHGAGQQSFKGGSAAAVWEALQEDAKEQKPAAA